MKRLQILAIVALIVALAVAACNGDDSSDEEANDVPAPVVPTQPTILLDEDGQPINDPFVGDDFGGSALENEPFTPGFRAFDDLTIVDQNTFVVDGNLHVALLVRNDGGDTIVGVRAVITLLNAEDIGIEVVNANSGQGNIPPGSTIMMHRATNLADFPEYSDVAVAVQQIRRSLPSEAIPFEAVDATATIVDGQIQGTATNATDTILLTPVTHVALFDEEGALLTVSTARIGSGLEAQQWRPQVTINIEASLPPLPEGSAAARVELLAIGYEYPSFSP